MSRADIGWVSGGYRVIKGGNRVGTGCVKGGYGSFVTLDAEIAQNLDHPLAHRDANVAESLDDGLVVPLHKLGARDDILAEHVERRLAHSDRRLTQRRLHRVAHLDELERARIGAHDAVDRLDGARARGGLRLLERRQHKVKRALQLRKKGAGACV